MINSNQAPEKAPSMPSEAVALARMVDFKIPLWGLISAIFVSVGAATSMHYELKTVSANLSSLQASVKEGNLMFIQALSKIERLELRVDLIEQRARYYDSERQRINPFAPPLPSVAPERRHEY